MECEKEASESLGSPGEISTLVSAVITDDGSVKPASAEVAKLDTSEGAAPSSRENNDLENVEASELSVDPSNTQQKEGDVETEEGNRGDVETEAGHDHSEDIDKEVTATDGNAGDESKAKDKQIKVDEDGDAVKGGKKKNISARSRTRKNKRMRRRAAAVLADEVAGASSDDQEDTEKKPKEDAPVANDASTKAKDNKGFIFMCSSKTKKDCFDYKVFGLPEGKKETVAKVYKGMKLFLYDIDLKLMYGTYEAAGPGGYNIEPKAFKSAFPSQVRFTVVTDSIPLSEEVFRNAIKANYYQRNKFNCLLSGEQVEKLCKLFKDAQKRSKLKRGIEAKKGEASRFAKRRKDNAPRFYEREWTGVHPNDTHQMVYYGREDYLPPVPSYAPPVSQVALHHPPPLPASYGYRGFDYYRRDVPVGIYSRESRDPHGYLWEHVPYRDPLYPPSSSARYYAADQPPYR